MPDYNGVTMANTRGATWGDSEPANEESPITIYHDDRITICIRPAMVNQIKERLGLVDASKLTAGEAAFRSQYDLMRESRDSWMRQCKRIKDERQELAERVKDLMHENTALIAKIELLSGDELAARVKSLEADNARLRREMNWSRESEHRAVSTNVGLRLEIADLSKRLAQIAKSEAAS